ncbi:7166_t:CDS:2, partial [Scutellospora calospora]
RQRVINEDSRKKFFNRILPMSINSTFSSDSSSLSPDLTILLLDDNILYENFTAADIKQKQLHYLPDSIPEDDLHYQSFEDIYGNRTTENYRPSLVKSRTKTKTSKAKTKHTMPFMQRSFPKKDKALLKQFLDTIFYTC